MRRLGWPVQLFHLAGSLLHVALLPTVAVAHNVFWRERSKFARLQGRSRMGRGSASPSIRRSASDFRLRSRSLARKLGRKEHYLRCVCCAARRGLISVAVMHNKYMLFALHDARCWHRLGKHAIDALRHPRRFSAVRSDGASTWAYSISLWSRRRSWHRCSSGGS